MKKSFSTTFEEINDYKRLHISAKISSHEMVNEETFMGDKYVLYIVSIFTFYKNWTLKKRYSNFVDLHRILQEKISTIKLIDFPPKRLFKNSENVILERKKKLEGYLNFLFKNVNICSYEEILNFIEIEKDLLLLLMKNNTMIENKTSLAMKKYYSLISNIDSGVKKARSVDSIYQPAKENYYSSFLQYKMQEENITNEKSANMMVVEEFLRNLEFKFESKCDIIKTFEQFLKSKKQWPNFKREEICKLYYGETLSNSSSNSLSSENSSLSRSYLKGLFFHIGSIEQNPIGAEACLEFLSKLIDYEFNPDCEAYIYLLKTSKIEYLQSLRLNDFILTNKNSLICTCFRILSAIFSEDKKIVQNLKKIISSDSIAEKFFSWLEQSRDG
jgi:hypothetical protein